MSLKMKVIVVTAVLVMLFLLVRMVKNRSISLKYALPWMLLCVGVGVFSVCTPFTSWVADILGIQVPSNMLFFMGFCFSLVLIFCTTLSLSHMSLRVKKLTQECALMEKELRELKERVKKGEEEESKKA